MPNPEPAARQVLEAERFLIAASLDLARTSAFAAGLSQVENEVVERLRELGPLRNNDLAHECDLPASTMSELVDRLVRKRVARRVPHPHDERGVMVELEPAYRDQVAAFSAHIAGAMLELCGRYDTDQLGAIKDFLDAATRIQQEAINRVPHGPSGVTIDARRRPGR